MTTQHVFHQLYNVSCSDDINIMINKAVAKKKKLHCTYCSESIIYACFLFLPIRLCQPHMCVVQLIMTVICLSPALENQPCVLKMSLQSMDSLAKMGKVIATMASVLRERSSVLKCGVQVSSAIY